jgi:hypothetical protein
VLIHPPSVGQGMTSIAKIAVVFVITIFSLNRFMFAKDEYYRLSQETSSDIEMQKVCDGMDFKKIGRHASLCTDIDMRLSSSLLMQVLKSVVNDTIHQDISIHGILTVFIGLSIVTMISNIHSKYVKMGNLNNGLPVNQKFIKYE